MYRDKVSFMQLGQRSSVETNDTVYIQQELIEDTSERSAIFSYFVFEDSASVGTRYESEDGSIRLQFNVDSLLRAKGLKGAKFYSENDSLIKSTSNTVGYDLFQTYIPKVKIDASYCDSTYMYFSKEMNSVPYSFSPELDRKTNLKLAKVVFVYNPGTSHEGRFIAGRKMNSEIKPLVIKNPATMIALFERYKKDNKQQ